MTEKKSEDNDRRTPEKSRLAPVDQPGRRSLIEATGTPPTGPAGPPPAADVQRQPELLYGKPPTLDPELLSRVAEGRGSLLALLVPASEVLPFCREPEDFDAVRYRIDQQVMRLKTHTQARSAMEMTAGKIQKNQEWQALVETMRNEDAYRTLLVDGICQQTVQSVRKSLYDNIYENFVNDSRATGGKVARLDLQEQVIIFNRGQELGLLKEEIEQGIELTTQRLRSEGWDVTIDSNKKPLVARDATPDAPLILSVMDLIGYAENNLATVLEDLTDSIEYGRLDVWLALLNEGGSATGKAAEEALRRYNSAKKAKNEKEMGRVLIQGAWMVLWSAGLQWLDLKRTTPESCRKAQGKKGKKAGAGASSRDRVGHYDRFRELVVDDDNLAFEKMEIPLAAGLVSPWLEIRNAPKNIIEAVRDAEREMATRGKDATGTRLALDVIRWRCGSNALVTPSGATIRDLEALLNADPEAQELRGMARDGFLARWVAEAYNRPEVFKKVRDVVPDGDDGGLTLQYLQWLLGRTSLKRGEFTCNWPEPNLVHAAATATRRAMLDFLGSIQDSSFALWAFSVDGPWKKRASELTKSFVSVLAEGGQDEDGARTALRALQVLGYDVLPLYGPDDGKKQIEINKREELAEEAIAHWPALSQAHGDGTLRAWLESRGLRSSKGSVKEEFSLYCDLWTCGWRTLPMGVEEAPADPGSVTELIAWVDARGAGVGSVERQRLVQAQLSGFLPLWLEVAQGAPDLARAVEAVDTSDGDTAERILACLGAEQPDHKVSPTKITIERIPEGSRVVRSVSVSASGSRGYVHITAVPSDPLVSADPSEFTLNPGEDRSVSILVSAPHGKKMTKKKFSVSFVSGTAESAKKVQITATTIFPWPAIIKYAIIGAIVGVVISLLLRFWISLTALTPNGIDNFPSVGSALSLTSFGYFFLAGFLPFGLFVLGLVLWRQWKRRVEHLDSNVWIISFISKVYRWAAKPMADG